MVYKFSEILLSKTLLEIEFMLIFAAVLTINKTIYYESL